MTPFTGRDAEIAREIADGTFEILGANDNSTLLRAIRSVKPDFVSAFVLDWVPEQAEDIFKVLVDGKIVVSAEVSRGEEASFCVLDTVSVLAYSRNVRGIGYRKLKAALRMFYNQGNPDF